MHAFVALTALVSDTRARLCGAFTHCGWHVVRTLHGGVRRVQLLKDDPVGWAVVIEFYIGVNIPDVHDLPPIW